MCKYKQHLFVFRTCLLSSDSQFVIHHLLFTIYLFHISKHKNLSYFGKNIRKIRIAKKLSQTEFAKIFNLTRASIGAYEEGRAEAKIDKIIEIAKYFDITIEQLLTKKITINEIYHYNKVENSLKFLNKNSSQEIPFIKYSQQTEYIENIDNQDFINKTQHIKLPNIFNNNYRAFEFFSQKSDLYNNSILVCEKINLKDAENITEKKLFIVNHQNFSLNYFSKLIKKDNILEIYEIKGIYIQNILDLDLFSQKFNKIDTKLNKILLHLQP